MVRIRAMVMEMSSRPDFRTIPNLVYSLIEVATNASIVNETVTPTTASPGACPLAAMNVVFPVGKGCHYEKPLILKLLDCGVVQRQRDTQAETRNPRSPAGKIDMSTRRPESLPAKLENSLNHED